MNIVVCVKQVPDTAVERTLTPGDGTLDRASLDELINEYAIEEGLKIADFGVVGDLFTVVPQLLDEITARKS